MNAFEIADMFVQHVKEKFATDVGIIIYYGSYATGNANPKSDIDLLFVSDEGKDLNLYSEFSKSFYEEGIPDIIQYIGSSNFCKAAEQVQAFDENIRNVFKSYNVKTNIFSTMNDLEKYIKINKMA